VEISKASTINNRPLTVLSLPPRQFAMGKDDYSFLFDPPKDSNVFTRTLYYPQSPRSLDATTSTSTATKDVSRIESSLGDNRHAATLSKFTAGVFSSNTTASETVAPFLSSHIPDQVHIPSDRGVVDNNRSKVYCYRHQPDLRCQRRTPQERSVAEIQKVSAFIRSSY
jgi:hypothetical protein